MRWISCIAIQASSTWNHDVSRIAFYPMPGNEARAKGIAQALSTRADVGLGACAVHHFPDGESLAQIQPPEPGAQAVLVCTLNQPDAKTVPLLMAASTLRDLDAARVACTDTVDHPVEAIDLTSDLAQGVLDMILPAAGHGAPSFPSIGQGAEP